MNPIAMASKFDAATNETCSSSSDPASESSRSAPESARTASRLDDSKKSTTQAVDLHGIDLCYDDFAQHGEVEAWDDFLARTPQRLAHHLYWVCTGRGVEDVPDEATEPIISEDDPLMKRCLATANRVFEHLWQEETPIEADIPIELPVPVAAKDMFSVVYWFARETFEHFYHAAGSVDLVDVYSVWERSEAAARRAVASLMGEAGLRAVDDHLACTSG